MYQSRVQCCAYYWDTNVFACNLTMLRSPIFSLYGYCHVRIKHCHVFGLVMVVSRSRYASLENGYVSDHDWDDLVTGWLERISIGQEKIH